MTSAPTSLCSFATELSARAPEMGYPTLHGRHVAMHATCGLGHRLLRNAQIFHAARRAGYAVRASWFPWTELFDDTDDLFGSPAGERPAFEFGNEASEIHPVSVAETDPEITLYRDLDVPARLRFDVGGCADEFRWNREVFGPAATDHTIDFHLRLASQLRPHWAERIDTFLADTVGARRLVAIHLRTGNGETGDFENKQRAIPIAEILRSFARELDREPANTAVLVASDSIKPASILRELTDHDVCVFTDTLPTVGHAIGDWVVPNASDDVVGQSPIERVELTFEAYADLLLLGMADHLYAGAWSSFLTAPVAMNRRRVDLGTQLTIYDTNRPGWRPI